MSVARQHLVAAQRRQVVIAALQRTVDSPEELPGDRREFLADVIGQIRELGAPSPGHLGIAYRYGIWHCRCGRVAIAVKDITGRCASHISEIEG